MNWASWSDFFAMGGYAIYVWGSLGMTVAVMAVEVLLLALRRRALASRDTLDMDTELPHETQV